MNELEAIRFVLKELHPESRLKMAVQNAVYSCVTAVENPSNGDVVVFFDFALADPYGKHSASSKNIVIKMRAPKIGHKSPQEIVEAVKGLCNEVPVIASRMIENEEFVDLWEVQEL
jgi:hypothetical protein